MLSALPLAQLGVQTAPMANRTSLGMIGIMMTGVTAMVILIGIIVVQGHLTGRYVLEGPVTSTSRPI